MSDDDARKAAEVDAAWAQHRGQRTSERDLAFNGLLDQRTAAAPRTATPEALAGSFDTVSRLSHSAANRPFTQAEQAEWTSALGTQAGHYAAEEGRAR